MNDLEGFFLVEEFGGGEVEADVFDSAAGTIVIPTRSVGRKDDLRRPIDPGYVLGWTEWPADNPAARERRRGMVTDMAPKAKSVWVIPEDKRPGEGMHVVVLGVVADSAAGAHRVVGGPGDYYSTAVWQSPRLLPRPYRRTHTVVGPNAQPAVYDLLHSRPGCNGSEPRQAGRTEVVGDPVAVDDCYLFEGALHPMSRRPVQSDGRHVPLCWRCMAADLPK